MLRAIENSNIPVIAGGVFPTFAPEVLLSNKNVHIVCVGEGEEAIVELCKRISLAEDYSDVENLWFIKDGQMIRNRPRKPIDINNLPIPDYSLFEPERFLR